MSSLKNKTLTIIGVGNIGRILLRSLVDNCFLGDQLVICDSDSQRQSDISSEFGVRAVPLAEAAAWGADLILIAVPPKTIPEIVGALTPRLRAGQVIVSFAAAIPLQRLEKLVSEDVAIVRVMPNAASLVGQGINPVV